MRLKQTKAKVPRSNQLKQIVQNPFKVQVMQKKSAVGRSTFAQA